MNFIGSTMAFRSVVAAVILTLSTFAVGAEGHYAPGHGALEVFGAEAMAFTPLWVKVWLFCLIGLFAIGTYFAWKHPVARWATGGFIVSMLSGHIIFARLGLPFLGGSIAIMHLVCWTPALVILLRQRPFFKPAEPLSFRIWSGLITAAIVFSFSFDINDATTYINYIRSLE